MFNNTLFKYAQSPQKCFEKIENMFQMWKIRKKGQFWLLTFLKIFNI